MFFFCNKKRQKKLEENSNSEFRFDWTKLETFSIERTYKSGHWHTAIGYIHQNQIGVWYYECSLERHKELVAEFEAQRKK